jgi:hypothetical protein
MSKTEQHQNEAHRKHETSDVNIKKILAVGSGLLLLTFLSMLAMVWVFNYMGDRQAREDVPVPDFALKPPLPPEPRLQVTPTQDLQAIRSAEETELNSYGWVDKDQGMVRIPIDKAMELLLQRGLPARGAAKQARND